MKKAQYLLLIFLMVFVFSCKKDNAKNDAPEQEKTNKVLDRILGLGFSKSSIVEYDDYYLVGDLVFPKNDETVDPVNVKQGRGSDLVSVNRTLIRVFLNNNFTSIFNSLSAALDEALTAYNGSIYSEILFVRTTDPAQAGITVTRDDFIGQDVCGAGGLPFSDGRPFNTVRISETVVNGLGHYQLVALLIHELGHNIGLRHTNWAELFEPAPIQIPGTPSSDGNSVMNGRTCGNGWYGFSNYDKIAVSTLYPKLPSGHQALGSGSWTATKAMTSIGDTLYIVENERLYKANKTNGTYTRIGNLFWTATVAMTNLNGMLYIVENQYLYQVNPGTGVATRVGNLLWTATNAMTSLNGLVYIVENQRLYQVDPATGIATRVGNLFWTATEAMTSLNGSLYIVENSTLCQVDPVTGTYTPLGGKVWNGTDGMTTVNGWLYIVVHNRIYRADASGNYNQFGGSVWEDTKAFTSIGNELFIIQNTSLMKIPI